MSIKDDTDYQKVAAWLGWISLWLFDDMQLHLYDLLLKLAGRPKPTESMLNNLY